MQVIISLDGSYDGLTGDLTGAELESLTKIMGKLVKATEYHLRGEGVLVSQLDDAGKPVKLRMEARVCLDKTVMNARDYEKAVAIDKKNAICKAVKEYLAGGSEEEFITEMYHRDVIGYNERKCGVAAERDGGGTFARMYVVTDDGPVIRTVNVQGEVSVV